MELSVWNITAYSPCNGTHHPGKSISSLCIVNHPGAEVSDGLNCAPAVAIHKSVSSRLIFRQIVYRLQGFGAVEVHVSQSGSELMRRTPEIASREYGDARLLEKPLTECFTRVNANSP